MIWRVKKGRTLFIFCTQQYTSGIKGNILTRNSWCETTQGRHNQRTDQCRSKYNWIYGENNNKYGISHHFQDTYQFSDFRARRKIFRVGHRRLLLINTHGAVIIYENKHQINYTRPYHTAQVKWTSLSRWMGLYGKYTRNAWITAIWNPFKQLTRTTFENHGYYQVKRIPVLLQHVWRPISLTLVVENFGISYVGRYQAYHLMMKRSRQIGSKNDTLL